MPDPTAPKRPLVVLLHAFGLAGRSWAGVIDALGDGFDHLAPDLPGFGADADADALTVEQTVAWIAERVREAAPERWLLVGHSMGGKLATVLTRAAEAGEHGLVAPDGVVLVDGSPPSPEPMSEARRSEMADWARSGPLTAGHAEEFIDGNAPSARPALRAAAVADARRTAPTAWLQWLERGSREDWSREVGVLRTPAVFVVSAGGDLGEAAQRALNEPHYPGAPIHRIDGTGHFVVLERPEPIAQRIAALWHEVADAPVLPPAFARLIASDRVSARTRGIMLGRLAEPPADAQRALSPAQRRLLTALLARVLPQRGTDLDLAGRMDVELAAGRDDGWRFADLPPDAEAWRTGLDTVAAVAGDLGALPAAEQDGWIARFCAGEAGSTAPDLFDGARMALWFQDVRAEAVRVWLSHPAAQAWLRYDGFADGGDGERKQGFLRTHAGEREAWQRDWRTGAAWPAETEPTWT